MRKGLQVFLSRFFLLMFSFITQALSAQQQPDSVIFRDDFDRTALGDFWQPAPSWSIVNSSAYNYIDGAGGILRTTETYSQPSYIIETKASGFTNSYGREFSITFGQANLSDTKMYLLSYKPNSGGTLTLSRSTDGDFPEPLDEVVLFPSLNSSVWYNFKIARYKSGLIQIFIDKGAGYGTIPLLEAIDQTYTEAGHIGWQVDTQTFAESFYVDWITAYIPAIEKPAVREKPAEDDLITQVSAKSGKVYKVAKLDTGVKAYTDRDYTMTSMPAYLNGASFIQTAMDDKKVTSDTFLTFFVKKDAIVYVGYDPRGHSVPAWLTDGKWTKTGDYIGTNDPGSYYLEVYSRLVQSGEVYPAPLFLGGNLANPALGSEFNYLVAAIPRPAPMPLQAEDAFLAGTIRANNHIGYKGTGFADFQNLKEDYVEWTVKIDVPGTYNLGFTYANGDAADRPLQIKNNEASLGIFSFTSTSSWSSWSFLSGPNVFLTSGVHTIRATAIGSSGPNIDELSLYYISSMIPVISAKNNIENNNFISYLSDESNKAYPNPFVGSTTISYTLKEKAKVSLFINSIEGKQIKLLFNNVQDAGKYQSTFNASGYPAGIYFYRLQIDDKVKVGKLIKK